MKRTAGQRTVLILSVILPSLYLLMYVPIWNGKELHLSGATIFPILLFTFQCLSLAAAVLQLLFVKLRNSDSCLLTLVFGFFFIGSFILTCFYGFLFVLTLFNVQWFPAQR